MRILFVVPYAPSLIRVRSYQFIRHLAMRDNHVAVAAPWTTEEEREDLAALAELGCDIISARLTRTESAVNCMRACVEGSPMQSRFSWSPKLAGRILAALERERFDAVHVEHLRGAWFGLEMLRRFERFDSPDRPTAVWDSVDCISSLFADTARHGGDRKARWAARVETPRTRRFEALLVNRFDRVVTTTRQEAQALASLPGAEGARIPAAVGNGVDLDYFERPGGTRNPESIVMTGKMSYHANAAAAHYLVEQVMPLVWRERPGVRLEIVGKNPPRRVRDLGYFASNGAGPAKRGGVTVTGETPDLRPHLWRAAVAVAPIVYGAGVQNKVLEAMAASTPVVTTPIAARALDAVADRELCVGGDAAGFAAQILRLLGDSGAREEIGAAGRRYVEREHRWERSAEALESIYAREASYEVATAAEYA